MPRRPALLLLLLAGCAGAAPRPAPGAGPGPGASAAPAGARGDWSFAVSAGPGARELSVQAELGPGSGEELSVDHEAEPFVRGVEVDSGEGFRAIEPRGTSWAAPGCSRGCRLRYRFALADAARQIDDIERAGVAQGALFAPPSTWLLRPVKQAQTGRLKLRVDAPAEAPFVGGFLPSAGGFEADTDDLPEAPYSAFGRLERRPIELGGGTLSLAILPRSRPAQAAPIERWTRRAAEAVAGYFRRFPIAHATVFVLELEGNGVGFGRTLGNGGGSILIAVGTETSEDELSRDWVMPHELLHLAFPSVPRHQAWMEEGLSTYLEPVIRARAGQLSPEAVWRDFYLSMPQGQPQPGDRGLDATPTWGRLYWGGAVFCLLADVEIQKRTRGQRSLADALRAINAEGGTVARRWSLERALQIGDQATGTTALRDLHGRYGLRPDPYDLAVLWRDLGVELRAGSVIFNDAAPLASIRKAITERQAP